MIIGAAYLPDLFARGEPVVRAAEPGAETQVKFEFHEILERAEVPADPDIYVDPAKPARTGGDFLLQAASFRRAEDAEKLRANLILMNLPAATAKVQLDSGAWYRVLVGPFASQSEADRAVTKLREQNVPVMWIRKKPA
ncbi:MAG: SPOR domain-containing protein [Proteobacteria bacterium]|nr:SPOR domain-containing protein [Pseudomonadota bacterium]